VDCQAAASVDRVWLRIVGCLLGMAMVLSCGRGGEYHVALDGSDTNPGTRAAPLRTIQRAADLAQPGDVITVHAGVYRERVDPPRGGTSDTQRIVYRAAPGEHVEIAGSEVVRGWQRVRGDVWSVTLPTRFFGEYNPYAERLHGDWFEPIAREHHTGAVYLNGEWLEEAATLEEVLAPRDRGPRMPGDYLLNLAWLRPRYAGSAAIPVTAFDAKEGVGLAPCDEAGQCLAWIEDGDWARYPAVSFGPGTTAIELRVASAGRGGIVELRLDGPTGELLGTVDVLHTTQWDQWVSLSAQIRPLSGVRTLALVFRRRPPVPRWFARVDAATTTIWAQFPGKDPNRELVEINVRPAVFYPSAPGRDFVTVRGFTMRHAATPWASPTAEQIGVIGTHWSKGWIIEDNTVSHATCACITLGKYGDSHDNTSGSTPEGFLATVERALVYDIPWERGRVGHHIVRGNTISHCEQAGIVGSLGGAFSTIEGNTIHDIHVRRLYTGMEMAGIKLHGAIDTVIRRNHLYRSYRGVWLDWMAQGARITQNVLHDNGPWDDLFLEVNHGPFLVDHNLLLSGRSLWDMSQGGAYAHNLFAGEIIASWGWFRETPYHPAHATAFAGLRRVDGGDNRFFNNMFLGPGRVPARVPPSPEIVKVIATGYGLTAYDTRPGPMRAEGNVYLNGARPSAQDVGALVLDTDPDLRLEKADGRWILQLDVDPALGHMAVSPVTSALLGRALVSDLPYVNADDSPLVLDRDYAGRRRSLLRPTPGPFEAPGHGRVSIAVWESPRTPLPSRVMPAGVPWS